MRDWKSDKLKLRHAVESTLENIAFCIVNEVENESGSHGFDMISTYITCTLEDGEKIVISLSLHETYLEKIVLDLYPDSDNSLEYVQDTLDEFINTVAGIYLRSIENEIGAFRLSIPYHEHPQQKVPLANFYFLLDDTHPLIVALY